MRRRSHPNKNELAAPASVGSGRRRTAREGSARANARRSLAALSMMFFALVAPSAYLLERVYEVARGGRIDPALVLVERHTAFYWRAAAATWWGALAAVMCALVVSRSSPDVTSGVARGIRRLVLPLGAVWTAVAWGFA